MPAVARTVGLVHAKADDASPPHAASLQQPGRHLFGRAQFVFVSYDSLFFFPQALFDSTKAKGPISTTRQSRIVTTLFPKTNKSCS